jgi:hypothetical protein
VDVLASELEAPGDVVLAADTIYFLGQSGGVPTIIAVPKPGGPAKRIVDEARNVLGMAVDAQGFYWLELPDTLHDAQVWMIARAGDQPRMVVNAGTGVAVHGLALDASHVWWTAFNAANPDPLGTKQIAVKPGVDAGAPERVLRRAPRAGGPIEDIAYGDNLSSLFAVRDDVYVADPLLAYRDGGRNPTWVRAYVASGLAADDSWVYWLEKWLVRRVPLVGGPTTDLAALQDVYYADHGAAYGGSYFVAYERELLRVDGDGTTSLVLKGRANIAALAADASGIYWTTSDGRLLRTPLGERARRAPAERATCRAPRHRSSCGIAHACASRPWHRSRDASDVRRGPSRSVSVRFVPFFVRRDARRRVTTRVSNR